MAALTPSLAQARRLVVKIGSALLVGPDGAAHAAWLTDFAADVARLHAIQIPRLRWGAARCAEKLLVSQSQIRFGPVASCGNKA